MDRLGGGSDDRSRASKMDASEVRRSWARVLESVKTQKKAVIIVRYRRPIAAIVPLAHLPEDDREGL
jgi:antitoxin (DNA-binding transcriptional repressor) of toxin-antitoxin stability system